VATVGGVVMQLLQQGLSERMIRAIIPVGGSRVARLRGVLKDGVESLHTRRLAQKPSHAFSDDDTARFKAHCATWILEDGFPCAHRRPRQYFTEPKLTWKTVHAHYKDDIERESPGARTLSYSRFCSMFVSSILAYGLQGLLRMCATAVCA
jgi:hypothetical protein